MNVIPLVDLGVQHDSIKDELEAALKRVLEERRFILGPDVKALEEEVAAYLGCKYALGVGSGTDAIEVALVALGIGDGDEVITTPYTFIATAESICNVGAKPVFVDINSKTYCIDVEKIEEK